MAAGRLSFRPNDNAAFDLVSLLHSTASNVAFVTILFKVMYHGDHLLYDGCSTPFSTDLPEKYTRLCGDIAAADAF